MKAIKRIVCFLRHRDEWVQARGKCWCALCGELWDTL